MLVEYAFIGDGKMVFASLLSVCVDSWFILGAIIALHHRCAASPSPSLSLTQAR